MRWIRPLLFAALVLCVPDPLKAQADATSPMPASALSNPGEPRLRALASRLASGRQNRLVVVQLGDSHTAADFFTDRLRTALQAAHGDGGIGRAPPMAVPGLLTARVAMQSAGWTLIDSRTMPDPGFPLGGFLARPGISGAATLVSPVRPEDASGNWRVTLWLRGRPGATPLAWRDGLGKQTLLPPVPPDGRWRPVGFTATLPFTLVAPQPEGVEVGGMLFERPNPPRGGGAQVDAIGNNGAKAELLQRWGQDWPTMLRQRNPDLVILAFGTNEAVDWAADPELYRASLRETVAQLRNAAPKAVLLMIGPPDLIGQAGTLDMRCTPPAPIRLSTVIDIQRETAREAHALFWDWQQAMGGPCSMPRWQAQGWGNPDGTHMTYEGYRHAADLLLRDLAAVGIK